MGRPGIAAALATLVAWPAASQTVSPSPLPAAAPDASAVVPSAQTRSAVEQIVVTANKRREAQRTVANSVTAISGKDLERRRLISVQDLVGQVPGLSVEAADKTNVRIVLRGLNTGGVGTEVASVLDDVPTNPTGAQNQAAINTPNFDTYDLQRIEVLRGPQSTLYGATAEGGLIKYVTNPPDPTRYSGSLEGGVDGTTGGGIGGTLKGFANIPLANGRAAVRITGWNEWIPGFIDNPELGKTNYNSGQQYGWRASILATPIEDLTVRLTAERQSLFSNGSDLLQVEGAAATPGTPPPNQLSRVDGLRYNSALPTQGQVEDAVYYANVSYDAGWSTLTSITGFDIAKFKNLFDLSDSNLAPGVTFSDFLDANVYGTPNNVRERQDSDTDKFSQELRLTSDPGSRLFGQRLDWLAGGYYTHETALLLQGVDVLGTTAPRTVLSPAAGSTAVESALSEWAVFGQVDLYLLPNLDVALGGRFEGTAQRAQTINQPYVFYTPYGVNPELFSNDHDALYSIAPRWHLTDDTLLYFRVATGYRPGGPNIPVPDHPEIPSFYKPDRTTNYEFGVRQDLFDKKVAIDLTAFSVNWKSVQVLSVLGAFGFNSNAGSALSRGIEWGLTWVPLPGLKLNATGSYQDARITTDAPGIGAAAGDFLPFVPNVSNSVNVDYSWTMLDRIHAYVSGTWSFVGERNSNFAPAGTANASHVLLPSYNTGAIRAGAAYDRYELELYVKNIGNDHAITDYTSEGGANQTGQATIIQPRTAGFVARVNF